MKKIALTFILTFLVSFIFGGGIPKTMPDDFYIHYKSVGGSVSNHLDVVLKVGECSANSRKTFDSEYQKYSFTVTRAELEPLYNTLRALNAFKLKAKEDKSSHRGGEYVAYAILGKSYLVSNEGSFYIIKGHLNHFNESIDLITAFADRYWH